MNDDNNGDGGNRKTDGETGRGMPVWVQVLILILIGFALAVGIVSIWTNVVKPRMNKPKSEVTHSLVRAEHRWKETHPSEKMKGYSINSTQYVMDGSDSGCFTFTGSGANPGHTIRIILSFGDAKSRNLLLQQQAPLGMGVKSGRIKAEFCMMQTDNEYSVLATEALAESDYNDPSKTWGLMYDLMMTDTSGLDTTAKRADTIAGVVMKSGAARVQGKPEITAESITKGTFYQWAYAMSESQRAEYVPAVLQDGEPLNGSSSIYNPDDMWRRIRSLPAS